MFSVDNFYTIFNSYYGYPIKNNYLAIFQPHGSKDWADVFLWGEHDFGPHNVYYLNQIIMHDQEPFSLNQLEHFKNQLCDINKVNEFCQRHPSQAGRYTRTHAFAKDLTNIELLHLSFRTFKFPIFCHSEKNSQDIEYLENNHVIPCYYWWHGMIARDWFRHWERHNALTVTNKSHADYRFLIYSRDHTGTRQYRSKIINHLKNYQRQTNYNWNNNQRCSTLSATIDVNDANNSAIHLVAETLFDTDKIYLTEKVFKPMVMCQPFILFAAPGSLQYLRDYGFKTFEHIWSEQYDLIADAGQRKQSIFNLIDSLAQMSAKEFEELYQELLPIIAHNKTHFYSTKFQDALWNELQKSCSDALLKQQELSEQLPGGNWCYYLNSFAERNLYIPENHRNDLTKFLNEAVLNDKIIFDSYPALAKLFKNN